MRFRHDDTLPAIVTIVNIIRKCVVLNTTMLISVLERDVQPSTSQKFAQCVKPYCHEFRVKVIGIMYRGMAVIGGKVYLYAVI